MKKINIIVDNCLDGKTIKYVLEKHLLLSDNLICDLKKGEFIFVNGAHATVRKIVASGDEIHIIIPEVNPNEIIAEDGFLDVIYEDDDIIAVNKPAGMPTHPSRYHVTGTLANLVCGYLGEEFVFRSITRLDKDTTGVVLIAKNRYSAEMLNRQMRQNSVKKEYLAVCEGQINKEITIEAGIKKESERGIKRIVSSDGQYALTHCYPLKEENGLTLVKVIPKTGRTHQIRVHLAYNGNPLYGDYLYGSEVVGVRTMLHCESLTFTHPCTGEEMNITAKTPEDFIEILKIRR